MRIIAGAHKGRKLIEFQGEDIRPTTDRVKESIFNLISEYVPEAVVLDLFAGSASLSLEALSRGAKKAVMVDMDKNSVKVINENISKLSYQDRSYVVNTDALSYINSCREKFDLVFLDPPYNKGLICQAMNSLLEKDVLNDGAVIVTETDDIEEEHFFEGLENHKRRKYGRTFITVYIKSSE